MSSPYLLRLAPWHQTAIAGETSTASDTRRGRLLEREGAILHFARSFVPRDDNSAARRLAVDELYSSGQGAVRKEPLPRTEQDREDQQLELVDEVVLHQGLKQVTAAVDLNLRAGLLLERGDIFGNIPGNQGGVLP